MAEKLSYETRSDGVLYSLSGGIKALLRRKSASRVRVELWRGDTLIPPESGDLDSSAFRCRLADLAHEHFGETNGFAKELGLIATVFDAHTKEREQDAAEDDRQNNAPELVGTPYRLVDGGIVRLKNTREGEIPQMLTNFTARIVEEVVRDDGAESRRIYRLSGETKARRLPEVEVPAAQFAAMNWVPEKWGLSARITAGMGAKDYTREAIELLSQGARSRLLYAHTGWRTLPDGRRVYLHAKGAIGAGDVEVELEPGLESYALPEPDLSAPELAEAVRVSLRFLELAPPKVTAPLLAAAYLAPLSEIVPPDFCLWLWGATGSFKSTIAALLLSHFGTFSETTLPASFESTANAQERVLFLLKDTVAVVDDWRPAVSRGDASEMDRKAQRLLRATGNRQGRGRMTSDTSLRRAYPPRGVVVATAETLPEGPAFESAAARSLSINLQREDVNLDCLSELQRAKDALKVAMAGYIRWIASRYDGLSDRVESHRAGLRERLRGELPGAHPRTPDAAAALITSLTTLEAYARSVGTLSEEPGKELLARASAGVIEAARAHTESTKGGDPASRFVEILRSLFEAGRVYVKDKETGEYPPGWRELGWEETDDDTGALCRPRREAEFVGWAGEVHLYLDREAAYAAVSAFTARGGIPFGIKPRALWEALKRVGLSVTAERRTDNLVRIEKKPRRVVQIPKSAVLGKE
ncbi:MAG: hypothetical protein IRY88_14005 [Rubrobacteraceae bacterium]|nr:hypothetical protein [Rubrobacteraceae bacterium]